MGAGIVSIDLYANHQPVLSAIMLWFAAGAWLLLAVMLSYRAGWLAGAAIPVLLLGLAFYAFTAARFDLRELFTGHGDHWVAGGALAISALAAGKITEAAAALGKFGGQRQALTTSTLVLWCLAMVWLFPLVTGEIIRPRLSYDVRRWATVFPLGMYAACSFAAGQVTGIAGIADFGHVWTWIAFTVSLLALAGLFRHGWPVLRGQHHPAAAEDSA